MLKLLTEKEELNFQNAKCVKFMRKNEPEDSETENNPDDKIDKYKKVRDHCHLSGQYRGAAAHNICI